MNWHSSVTSDSHVPMTDNCAHLVFIRKVLLGALACHETFGNGLVK